MVNPILPFLRDLKNTKSSIGSSSDELVMSAVGRPAHPKATAPLHTNS